MHNDNGIVSSHIFSLCIITPWFPKTDTCNFEELDYGHEQVDEVSHNANHFIKYGIISQHVLI